MILSALIVVLSAGALVQFFVVYCRSLVAAYSQVEIAPKTRQLAAVSDSIAGEEFRRLLVLAHVFPAPGDDGAEIHAVSAYYNFVSTVRALFGFVAPHVLAWANNERSACPYFAAVTLDRRIAAVRE